MKTKNFTFLLLACSAFAFYSCDDDPDFNVDTVDPVAYVSMDGAGASLNRQELTFLANETFPINIALSEAMGKVVAEIEVSADAANAYNNANGTAYSILPADCYEFDETKLIIPAGATTPPEEGENNIVNLTFKPSTSLLEFGTEYLLPVTIKGIYSNIDVGIDDSKRTIYYLIKSIETGGERQFWTAPYYSSYWNDDNTWNPVNTLNDNLNSIWHTALNGLPQWFVVDMKVAQTINGFKLTNRQSATDVHFPKNVSFYMSETGEPSAIVEDGDNVYDGWTLIKSAELPDQREGDATKPEMTVTLDSPVTARYVMLYVVDSWVAGSNWTYLAKFDTF